MSKGRDGINWSLLDTGVPDSGAERLRGKISQCCVLRSFLHLRDTLVKDCSSQVLRMQKALTEMNVQVHRVLSDITGESGMAIIRAILAGEVEFEDFEPAFMSPTDTDTDYFLRLRR